MFYKFFPDTVADLNLNPTAVFMIESCVQSILLERHEQLRRFANLAHELAEEICAISPKYMSKVVSKDEIHEYVLASESHIKDFLSSHDTTTHLAEYLPKKDVLQEHLRNVAFKVNYHRFFDSLRESLGEFEVGTE